MARQIERPRVGLVLGAGGVLGGAWMAGGLKALWQETGWDPATASYLVGTSAGSVFAALTACGVSPDRLVPAAGALGENDLEDWMLAELITESAYRASKFPRPIPGSLRLALNGVRDRRRLSILKALSGFAPQGLVPTDVIERTVTRAAGGPERWAGHPACWIVACDYGTGERIVFGREGSPAAGIDKAVAASCAIPGFFVPVRIGDRCYVDGGLHSMSNADLLVDAGLDLVVVLNPLSSRAPAPSWKPLDRVHNTMRRLAAWQVDREVAMLLDAGTHVVVLEPTADDIAAIGCNLMDAGRARTVADVAMRSVAEQVRRPDVAELLELLPVERRTKRPVTALTGFLQRAKLTAAAAAAI